MNRVELIQAAMAAAGENASFLPVQVQKLFFLLDREAAGLLDGPHFNFRPYDYGPFDQAVYSELDALERVGCVDISIGRYRRYSLTGRGFAEGSRLLENLRPEVRDFVVRTSKWVRSLSFQQLVASIYRQYPDMKANSIFRQ